MKHVMIIALITIVGLACWFFWFKVLTRETWNTAKFGYLDTGPSKPEDQQQVPADNEQPEIELDSEIGAITICVERLNATCLECGQIKPRVITEYVGYVDESGKAVSWSAMEGGIDFEIHTGENQ